MDSSEGEELGGAYVLTVDDLGAGLWESVKDVCGFTVCLLVCLLQLESVHVRVCVQ